MATSPATVRDGVPCRPYVMGEHARLLGRMLVIRLVIAAAVAGILTPTLVIAFSLAFALSGTQILSEPMVTIGRALGSSVTLGLVLMLVDYLLIRRRLAPVASLLTWAGRQEAASLRASTGIRRPNDPRAARAWLEAHVYDPAEDHEQTQARVHLQLLVGDVDAARESIGLLPADDPASAANVRLLAAQAALAAGQPFDPVAVRTLILAVLDDDVRALMHVDLAALIAQARATCLGADTLEPVLAVRPMVGGRDRNTLLTSYWAPMAVLVLVSGLVLGFLFPG